MKGKYLSSIFFALLTTLFWSSVATAFKLGLKTYSPFELVFWSTGFSTFVLLILVLIKHPEGIISPRFNKKAMAFSLLGGTLNPFIYYLILFYSYNLLPARIAQPINFTWPVLLTFLLAIFFGKRVRIVSFLFLAVSLGGVIVLSAGAGTKDAGTEVPVKGIVLGFLSAFFWAFYWIVNLKDQRPELLKLFYYFLIGFVLLFLVGIISDKITFPNNVKDLFYPFYIGIFEMSLSFYFWILALKNAKNPALLGNLVYLSPVISLFIIHLVLEEPLEATTFIGLGLILFGVILQSRFSKERRS